ncbi:MAG: NAD(P)/FAD-dependent oxidoreductase [Candidatus Gracilibacteria bacterium]|jgi:hypothetical protein
MKIAIIGGGAAGMMAAAAVLESGAEHEVFLIEKNASLGQKVIISGGGRCNVTTGFSDLSLIAQRYPRGEKFLQSAFYRFSPELVREWFEAHGVPLKKEEDGRIFPVSNNGKDIVGVFETLFKNQKIKIQFKCELKKIEKQGLQFNLSFSDAKTLLVDKLILTTGGQAYRHTGSTGDGYAFAESLGHTITALAPSLNSFILSEPWIKTLAGVALKKAQLTVKRTKKIDWSGPLLFTHKGITGPAVFALSSLVAFEEYNAKNPLEIRLDLVPDLSLEALEKTLQAELQKNPKKQVRNLSFPFPKSLASALCDQLQIPEGKISAELSKKDFNRLINIFKNLSLHAIARGAGDEFVTAGGVDTDEVNPRTMESKICPGLYFAGEILNVDGFTGGYNLQCAWATGKLAGQSASGTINSSTVK